jgi:DNA-binding IscR family transcriptional regulator
VLVRAAERFRGNGGPVQLGEVARELDTNSDLVAECVAKLCDADTLVAVGGGEECYVLARDPAMISLALLADFFGEARAPDGADARVAQLLHALESERREQLAPRSLADLLALHEVARLATSPLVTVAEPARSARRA